jgi:hypothetical protein
MPFLRVPRGCRGGLVVRLLPAVLRGRVVLVLVRVMLMWNSWKREWNRLLLDLVLELELYARQENLLFL